MDNTSFLFIAGVLAVFVIWFFLRLLPRYFAPNGAGVDHWFWKAYIEKYRLTGKFPPDLPQFLLDEHQWYPPLFPLLMARLPKLAIERYSYLIANAIDMLRMLLVMASAFFLIGGTTSILVAGFVYALTPILISYNAQLNPRGLGAIFLDIVVMLLILLTWHAAPWWFWILVALFSGLILLTHKMTTQLFWFICLAAGILSGNWRFLLLIPASVVMALALSRGFYLNVLRAHWDIIAFWNRNWPWLSAHPVLESPIYGSSGYETPTKYFRSGFKGVWRRILHLIGFNPWGWSLLIAAWYMYGSGSYLMPEHLWIVQWLAAILLFVVLTTFIPAMRCLGNGYLYLYNSSFPAALVAGMICGVFKCDPIVNVILGATLTLCVISIGFYLWKLRQSKTLKIDPFMNDALDRLRFLPDGVVMCLPQHWHDAVSYKAKKPVLYGAHGYGFKNIEFIFPRLNKPISDVISKYRVRYLLTYNGYLPANFINDLPEADIERFGQYFLYRFRYA
jgi:hypothetical protein